MGLVSLLLDIPARWVRLSDRRPDPRLRRRRCRVFAIEGLEVRLPLSAVAPSIVMDSATTADSRSVTIEYDLGAAPDPGHPLVFGVYRSADARFDAGDVAAGGETIVAPGVGTPTLDLLGQPAAAPGHHRLTIELPGGLPPNPEHPYVLVVADPADALASGDPGASASFRVRVIGVVTHGGLQDKHWENGPPWALVMAHSLRREGYDVAIPFNWVSQSNHPGAAARQGAKLAHRILATARRFPASEPVDLHLIGHSEGTVVNTQALRRLAPEMPPQLRAGYVEVTMLDPHAANNAIPGEQYSVKDGPLGWLARGIIDSYQSRSGDPRVSVSPIVDGAQVFYQHTRASDSGSIYNLWGQVPVHGPADYFNLTGAGATHSGTTGVVAWYQRNVVPLLGDGAPEIQSRILTGALDAPHTGSAGHSTPLHRPTFSGTALPGSTVTLFGGPAGSPSELSRIGRTTVDAAGTWQTPTRPLPDGRYRVVALAVPPRPLTNPRLAMLPTAPLGLLVVGTRARG